ERLRANRAVESYLRERQALAEASIFERAGTAAGFVAAFGLAANAIVSWVVHGNLSDCEGKIRTLDQLAWQTKSHSLVKLPWCRACSCSTQGAINGHATTHGHATNDGYPASRQSNGHAVSGHVDSLAFRPLIFQRCKKTATRDGGHRVISA